MPIELDGAATSARIMADDESLVEESAVEQIQELIDHEAFTEPVVVMPDTHWGAGAPIGFTMALPDRIVPNIVGVDVGCFTGDTKVDVLDGSEHRIDDLASRDDSFGVYACTPEGEIRPAEATARQTREDASLVEVELDNGETVRCTPDHEFMLRDGTYREAQKLSSGDSLMPLYKGQTDDGYTLVYHNTQGTPEERSVREHWWVARSDLMTIPKDISNPVVHHENFDKQDDRPSNLTIMSQSDHSRLHRELSDADHWQSDEFEQKRIQAIKEREETEKEIEIATENITSWMEENPDAFREAVSDNGENGGQALADFNTSERECCICGDVFDNPAQEFWHQVKNHTEQTEYDIPPQYADIANNHEVVAVRELTEREDVYCLQVPKYHNFALSAGVFVHNCGMAATNLGDSLPLAHEERERQVREAVPMGRDVHDYDDAPHLVEEFPFERANKVFERFDASYREQFGRPIDPLEFDFSGYDETYFKDLCERVLSRKRQGIGHVIKSAGTLGGGNHFVEFAQARESGDYWLVIHSGSRYLGLAVAEYWQERATNLRNADAIREAIPEQDRQFLKFDPDAVSDSDLYAWITGGKGESHIDREAVLEAREGTEIERTFDRLNAIEPDPDERNTDLDYLDGREAHGYYVDMLFAQQYARWNRELMSDAICEALGVDPVERFQSIHNYIDFRDLTIRKGATPAREGQRLVVPFNMAEGSVLARGTGNDEWQQTAPHGAGRTMSRREASATASVEDLEAEMDGIYSESIVESVLDEAPLAYKPAQRIAEELAPTAEITDWLDPVHNLKATE